MKFCLLTTLSVHFCLDTKTNQKSQEIPMLLRTKSAHARLDFRASALKYTLKDFRIIQVTNSYYESRILALRD